MLKETLKEQQRIQVITDRPVCVYTKDNYSFSECWDIKHNKQLLVDDISDDYNLDVVETDDNTVSVFIPTGAKCTLKYCTDPNYDCILNYNNIECQLYFDETDISDSIDSFFSLLN